MVIKRLIFPNWSLFSLLAVLDPRLLSPYLDHLLPHLSKLQTVLFNLQHPAFGINFLTLFVSLSTSWFFTFSLPYTSRIHTVITTSLIINHSSFSVQTYYRYSLDWSHGFPAGPFFVCSSVLF